jgi:multidrug efflux pump subunit AcrA (membrane-fusion protein)
MSLLCQEGYTLVTISTRQGIVEAIRWPQMRVFRRPGLSIAIGMLVIAGVIAAGRARGPVVATTVSSRTDLEQHVIASGRVRVVTRIQLSAQISGRVVAVRVVEGQRIRAGDLLVQLDDAEATADVSRAKRPSGRPPAVSNNCAEWGRSSPPKRLVRR